MGDPSDEEKARIKRARAEYEAATRGMFVEETYTPKPPIASACGAVYRVIDEGGPARNCVLPVGHDGDHQDVRALRARVAELEAERLPCTCGSGAHPRRCEAHPRAYDAHCARLQREFDDEERAYREGAGAMRSEVLDEIRSMYGRQPLGPGDPGYNPALDEHMRGYREALDTLTGIVETLPVEDDAVNVCEHGDHAAPANQRFCSKACQECEGTDALDDEGCAGICDDAREDGGSGE